MTDEALEALLSRSAAEIAAEFEYGAAPAFTALFHRTFPTYTESMWINGYPASKCIVIVNPPVLGMPGVIRTLPVGWRALASEPAFRDKCERVADSYVAHGWVRKPHSAAA